MTTTETSKRVETVNLSIPCASDYVGVVRLAVSGIATRMNFSIEEIEDIKIAVSEACTNAVQYAYDDPSNSRVEIECHLHPEQKLEIVIIDTGNGFDVEATAKSKQENSILSEDANLDDPNSVPSLGLGMTFIKSLMDEAEFISQPGKGTTVRMAKTI
ncbi:histidine kinase [bacterium]|jgi:serine/threonine-protein kinase RsbW|nr:histidine kinase [bacterium]